MNVSNALPTVCLNALLPPELAPMSIEQLIARSVSRLEKLVADFQRDGSDAILPLYYKYWLHRYDSIAGTFLTEISIWDF